MPRFKRYDYEGMARRTLDYVLLDRPSALAVDTETSGFAWGDEAFCATVSWRDPLGRLRSGYVSLEVERKEWYVAVLRELLQIPERLVFHNAKFDLQKLILAGALSNEAIPMFDDTNIIHALLDENDRHGLKYLAKKLLGEETNEDEVLAKVRRKLKIKKDEGYHLLPREVIVPYAMKDTEFTLRLYELLKPKLPEELYQLYQDELNTALALLDIEGNGIGVDVPFVRAEASKLGVELMKLDAALQTLAHDPDNPEKKFNPNSPKQITEAFARRGVTVAATDKNTLAAMDDEFAKTLLEYRHKKKLHGTYLLPMLAEERDGIIHPNFNLTLPRTGRMSSSGATNN